MYGVGAVANNNVATSDSEENKRTLEGKSANDRIYVGLVGSIIRSTNMTEHGGK